MYDIVEKWEHLLETDGIITSDVYLADADPIDLIINHPERIAIIHRLLRETGWWAQETVEMNQLGKALIASIEKEIASR